MVQGSFCTGSRGSIALSCAHLLPCTMGKRGSHGAPMKRPASKMCCIADTVLCEETVADLEATRNIDEFRKSAAALGFRIRCTESRRFLHRDDILKECKQRLTEAHEGSRTKAEDYKRRRKVDVVEDHRQQLKELPPSSASASVPADLTAVDLNSITDQTLTAGSDE